MVITETIYIKDHYIYKITLKSVGFNNHISQTNTKPWSVDGKFSMKLCKICSEILNIFFNVSI